MKNRSNHSAVRTSTTLSPTLLHAVRGGAEVTGSAQKKANDTADAVISKIG